MTRRRWIAAALLLAAVRGDPTPGDVLQVTVFQTGLKTTKSRLGRDAATLKEGDELIVESVDPSWLGVTAGALRGFVLRSVVSPKGAIRLSAPSQAAAVSVEDRSAAQRGFNPEIERNYRKQRGTAAERSFAWIDRIEARTVDLPALAQFVRDGGLGGGRP